MISRSESREASVFTFRKNPPKKNPPFSYTRGGWTCQWEGRDRASGVLDVIVKVIEVALLSRKFKWPTLMRGWRGK